MMEGLSTIVPKAEHTRTRYPYWQLPFLPSTIAGAFRLLYRTCKITILGREHEEASFDGGLALGTCWHFAFPSVIHYFRDRGGMVMVSRSRDGELVDRMVKNLGYKTFRGSPGKGGSTALRQLISNVQKAPYAGFIADGSQGPALVAQKGILVLARYVQAPLVPISVAADPCWRFRSWDRTLLPKPFSHIVMAFGQPMHIDRDIPSEELDAKRMELENCLNGLTEKANRALMRR